MCLDFRDGRFCLLSGVHGSPEPPQTQRKDRVTTWRCLSCNQTVFRATSMRNKERKRLIILNQLHGRSQRLGMQFAGLSTFLPTKAQTLETKCDHGLIGHRLDLAPADLNVLDGNSLAGDVPIVPCDRSVRECRA